MSKTATPNINSLFQSAQNEGAISPQAAQALTVVDLGATIQAAMGTPVDQVDASSAMLLVLLVDDSGSIRFSGNSQNVRDGVNLVTDAMKETKQQDGILMMVSYINGTMICPFSPLKDVPKLTSKNYDPNGGTPLYDQYISTLAAVVAKTQQFSDRGVPVRSVICVISDGQDEGSIHAKAHHCTSVSRDLLMSENHIIAAIGIDNGACDFRRVFQEMGIEDRWIMVVDAKDQNKAKHEIRQAFQTVSQTAVRASQTPQSFSQTAMGGFGGNP